MTASTAALASPTRATLLDAARRTLLSVGAIAAACLLFAYVQVCHESVARGERWRAEQRTLANPPTVLSAWSERNALVPQARRTVPDLRAR